MPIPSLILTSSSSFSPRRRFFVYPDPKGSKEPSPALLASLVQPESVYSPWGWGKSIDFQEFLNFVRIIAHVSNSYDEQIY
jgi:hypothetical protein